MIMGFGLYSVAPVPLTLSQLSVILPVGTVAKITDYGGTIAISDGVRWRLERLYLSWAGLPPASLVPIGTEASVSDCGGAIAVAGVTGWVFRPIEIFNSSASVVISGAVGSSEQVAYQFTLPANLMGIKGTLAVESTGTFSVASANSKNLRMRMAGLVVGSISFSSSHRTLSILGRAKNVTRSSQVGLDGSIFSYGGSSGGLASISADTTVDLQIQITMALGGTAETCTFQGIRAVVYPSM